MKYSIYILNFMHSEQKNNTKNFNNDAAAQQRQLISYTKKYVYLLKIFQIPVSGCDAVIFAEHRNEAQKKVEL